MFKASKKTKDDNTNPFEGYVADGLAAADFEAEAQAEAVNIVQAEPTPTREPLSSPSNSPAPSLVIGRQPAPVATPQPSTTASATPQQATTQTIPVQQVNPSTQTVQPDPINVSQEQVDTAIKEAEASTELPSEELLESGATPISIPPVTPPQPAEINQTAQEAPVAAPQPVNAPTPPLDAPAPTGQEVPVVSTDEERAKLVAENKELADLLGWADRDTNGYLNEVQAVINDLNAKIDHLRTTFDQDTVRLEPDAKIAFKDNIEKNISLLKDQITKEQAKKDVLRSQKDEFVDRVYDALRKYREAKRR